jgi:hypothetical protein
MGCIVDNFQVVFVGNFLNASDIAGGSIYVHGHDGSSAWSDGLFNLVRINITRHRIDIYEYRFDSVPL